jgi:gas vesicle protein
MTDSPDAIRADIENTRRELGSDVDALADKVTPSKIVHRQTDKVKDAVGSVKDRIMGAADDVRGSAGSAAGSAGELPGKVVAKAEGNPLAVGLIAFGVGLLAASLIPASPKEKELASSVKDSAQPLVDEVTGVAKDMAQNLKEPAQEAANAVKDSATDAASTVKDQATSSVDEVKSGAQDARDAVRDGS